MTKIGSYGLDITGIRTCEIYTIKNKFIGSKLSNIISKKDRTVYTKSLFNISDDIEQLALRLKSPYDEASKEWFIKKEIGDQFYICTYRVFPKDNIKTELYGQGKTALTALFNCIRNYNYLENKFNKTKSVLK